MVDSMAGTGRLQEEDDVCQKIRSALKRGRGRITRTQEPGDRALIRQIRDSHKTAIPESIWVMDRGKESSSLALEYQGPGGKDYSLTFP